MAKLTADEVVTQQHVRGFIAYGDPQPGTVPEYYGIANQYFSVTGVSNPVSGGISPINMPDPRRRKRYKAVGRAVEPADFGEYELAIAHKHFTLPRALGAMDCPITVYLTVGRCSNPADLNRGYEDYLYLLANGEVTDRDNGDMFPMDSDEAVMTTLSVVTAEQYGVGRLNLNATAANEINAEGLDITYAPPRDCEGCEAGTQRIYSIHAPIGGSPTFQAEVQYTINGGQSWASANITGLAAGATPTAVAIMGNYIVVLVNSVNGYFWALLDEDTGAPGTWSQVTTGFAAGGNPNDIHVIAPNDAIIVGNGGYIYRLTDIGSGVTVLSAAAATTNALRRVHGNGEVIVAGGALGTVVYSLDRGVSWATVSAGSPTSANITAVAVKTDNHFWVGAGNGNVWYTLNGGKTWMQDTETAPGATQIFDIVFATDHIGYCSYIVSGPAARLACTVDGGQSWVTGAPGRINGVFPTFNRGTRIATPQSGAPQTDANFLAITGLAGDGSDGVTYIAQANIL